MSRTFEQRSEGDGQYSRRGVLRAGAGIGIATVGLGVTTGTAAATPYDGWFDEVENYEGTVDYRDEDEVHVTVGAGNGLLYDPPAILVDSGTTVVWEWTGEGGQHDVAEVDDAFASELVEDAGHTFEHTFDEEGIFRYVCTPHEAVGMKGAVAVDVDIDDGELIAGPEDDSPAGGIALSREDAITAGLGLGLAGTLFALAFAPLLREGGIDSRD